MTTALTNEQYRAELDHAGREFASLVSELDPDTPVPSCPGWTVGELVAHLGGVHFWAASIVRGSGPKLDRPAPDGELSSWYLRQLGALQKSFEDVGEDSEVWTFVGPKTTEFWYRRQAHETAMHLCDAQLAAGKDAQYPSALSADSVSEVFDVMTPRMHKNGAVPVAGPITFAASDGEHRWTVRPSSEPALVDYEYGATDAADCVVTAPVGSLALGLWRRTPVDQWQIRGDRERVLAFLDAPLTP